MWLVNDKNRETVHTYTAIGLIVSGVTAFFLDLCVVGNIGEVGTGTLAYIGEAFTLAGALFGIVSYVGGRMAKVEKHLKMNEEK